MNTCSSHPTENHLLDALPDAERQRRLPQLERVDMPLGQILIGRHADPCLLSNDRHRLIAGRDGDRRLRRDRRGRQRGHRRGHFAVHGW